MSAPNYAGNIIASLASLPEFLRKPMLTKRMAEFPGLSEEEKAEVISNALDAAPEIPFPTFAKLFGTWLQVLAEMPPAQRQDMLERYARDISAAPQRMAALHVDGILGVFLEMDASGQGAIMATVRGVIRNMEPRSRKTVLLLMPDSARAMMGL